MKTRERIAKAAAEHGWTVETSMTWGQPTDRIRKGERTIRVEYSKAGAVITARAFGGAAPDRWVTAKGKAEQVIAWLEVGPRYEARMNTLPAVPAIYDTYTRSWPAYLRGLSVPQSFDTLEAAQAWADEHLNGRA